MSTFLSDPVRSFEIFANLTDYQFRILRDLIKGRRFSAGQELFAEGSDSDELWLLIHGKVEISKRNAETQKRETVATFSNRCVFGEVAFLHGLPRTASAHATTDCACAVLSRKALEEQHPDARNVLRYLTEQIGRISAERVRLETEARLETVRMYAASLQDRLRFGELFVYVVLGFGFVNLVANVVETNAWDPNSPTINWAVLVILIAPVFYLVRRMGVPMREFGITSRNIWGSLLEGVLLAGVSVGAVWAYRYFSGGFPFGLSFNTRFMTFLGGPTGLLSYEPLTYIFHAFIQEFVCRGVVQSSLQRFLLDKRGLSSLSLTAAIFALVHTHHGIPAVLLTFGAGVLFGLIYLRHKNLIGVTVIHWALGLMAICFGLM